MLEFHGHVRSKTGKKTDKEDITSLNINGRLIQNQQTIANSFNNYFATVAESNRIKPY
jgi:hypothetical protein